VRRNGKAILSKCHLDRIGLDVVCFVVDLKSSKEVRCCISNVKLSRSKEKQVVEILKCLHSNSEVPCIRDNIHCRGS